VFLRFPRLPVGRGDQRCNALVKLGIELGRPDLAMANTGVEQSQQFDEAWRHRLHEIKLLSQSITEFRTDSAGVGGIPEVILKSRHDVSSSEANATTLKSFLPIP
jgi:hypothetical protein